MFRKKVDFMKLPNGYGSIYKLSGKRRKPWIVRKTVGWKIDPVTHKSKQQYITIGNYTTRADAMAALANYNENPYDIKTNSITFSDVYELWSKEHFETIVPSACRTWKSAYSYCSSLYNMRFKDLRASHLEGAIRDADVGSPTKSRMKSLFNMLYRYALKHDIVDKNYAELCDSVKNGEAKIIRIPFSDKEIKLLWDNLDFPFVDMILIGIYSGWRPQELAILKVDDINLEAKTFYGGLKSDAGRNRIVPIHPAIFNLVENNYDSAIAMGSKYLFNDPNSRNGIHMTYDKYRGRFNKVNTRFGMKHKPHDTRHTFITAAKAAGVDEYILKLIVGHSITDVTEATYTHRTIQQLYNEICKISK